MGASISQKYVCSTRKQLIFSSEVSGVFELRRGGWRKIFIGSLCVVTACVCGCVCVCWHCMMLLARGVHVWPQLRVWLQLELPVFARRVCCMFTGLQCRAWWRPAEMMGLETQLCLWVSPSSQWGTFSAVFSMSQFLAGFLTSL